jgi:hypothetical protein
VNYVAGGRTHPATAQSDKPLGPDAVTKLGMDQYALGCKLPSIFWSMYQYGLADAAPAAAAREPQTELDRKCSKCGTSWSQGRTTLGTLANPLPNYCPTCSAPAAAGEPQTEQFPVSPDWRPPAAAEKGEQAKEYEKEWRDAYMHGYQAGIAAAQASQPADKRDAE